MFQFSIRELLLVTLIAALAAGWWVDRRSPRSTVPVFFQPEVGQPERIERPLFAGLTVQQVLAKTDGAKKYPQFEVEVIRPLPHGGFQQIPCEIDGTTKQIKPGYDFILLPGDQILVKDKSLSSTVQPRIAPSSPFGRLRQSFDKARRAK